ncbi:hypothetical protein HKD37_06G016470 [Glycine soja]
MKTGVCYFTTKRLPEERVPPERDTWLVWTGRCDRGGRVCLPGATSRAYLPGATSSGRGPGATTSDSLAGTSTSGGASGTSLFPIKPSAFRFIFTQKSSSSGKP